MNKQDFLKLDTITKTSLIIAMYLRNELEDFHSKHLSDSQMMELNPIIRQATYNILTYLELAGGGDIAAQRVIDFQMILIPDYWELPSKDSPREYLDEVSKL
ncbi:MAG: hypothetical protein Q8K75_01950 [Chlamydiales bacterium]|nr:hypothetical protein [Chlamydiales bacterium]